MKRQGIKGSRIDSVIGLARELAKREGRPIRVVEIGVLRGDLTKAVLKAVGPAIIELYLMVDPWTVYDQGNRTQEMFDEMIQDLSAFAMNEDRRAVVMQRPSLEAVPLFPEGAFDLVFIDGHHGYEEVMKDIRAWWPLVTDTGVLSGHDYRRPTPGVVQAVDESFVCHTVEMLPGTVWAVRKDGDSRL